MLLTLILVAVVIGLLIYLAPISIGDEMVAVLIGLFFWALLEGISFLFVSGLIWLICWAFSLTFSWKVAFGIWLIWSIILSIFKPRK